MVMDKGGWSIGQAGQDVTYPLWVPGRYYGPTEALVTTTAVYHEMTFVMPIYVPGPNGAAVDELGLEITAGGTAGGLARVGIYDDFEGWPWDLIVDAGTIPIDGVGWQHVDVAVRLRGWVWLAICFDDYVAQPTYRAVSVGIPIMGFARADDTSPYTHLNLSGGRAMFQAGLPARVPLSGEQTSGSGNFPRLMVRSA